MNINISTQILSGNLGDGWTDQNDTADALAAYTRSVWLGDLASVEADGHNVQIYIDVQHNTEGCGRDVSIDIDGDDTYDMMCRVRDLLTDENAIWESFCNSEAAEALCE